MIPKILFRAGSDLMDQVELQAAKEYFDCLPSRMVISRGDLVIPRYSLYPWAKELISDIEYVGAKTINSYSQVQYISDLGNYIPDLGELTPLTWTDITAIPEGSFVLKGETNSKKNQWNKLMFASNKQEAIRIYGELSEDSLIGNQKIYIREYVPLKKFMTGVNGQPIVNEYRFFIAYGNIVAGGYYWQNYICDLVDNGISPSIENVPTIFLQEVIDRIGDNSNAFVVDVAETEDGEWMVVELNLFEQSGLSEIHPRVLYNNLFQIIRNHYGQD